MSLHFFMLVTAALGIGCGWFLNNLVRDVQRWGINRTAAGWFAEQERLPVIEIAPLLCMECRLRPVDVTRMPGVCPLCKEAMKAGDAP